MFDGISGLVTQPFEGAKKEGVLGLIKGFGKGIGGVVLKPGAGKSFLAILVAALKRSCVRACPSHRIAMNADLAVID